MSKLQAGIDYIGVGVGAIIVNDLGQVLLAQRGPKARNRVGQWENPGGSLDFGEEFDDAIIREIREELDIEVRVEGLLRIVNHVIAEEHQHWVAPTFIVRLVSGTPRITEPEKCSAIGWFDLNDLPEPMAEISAADLEYCQRLIDTGGVLQPVEWCRVGGP